MPDVIVESDVNAVIKVDELVSDNAPIQRDNESGETDTDFPTLVALRPNGELRRSPMWPVLGSAGICIFGVGRWHEQRDAKALRYASVMPKSTVILQGCMGTDQS